MSLIDYNKVKLPVGMDFENYAVFMNWANGPLGMQALTSRQRSSITFGKLWKERYLPVEKLAIRSTVEVRAYFGTRVGFSRTTSLHFITLTYTKFFGIRKAEVPFMKVKNYLNYLRFQHQEARIVDIVERNMDNDMQEDLDDRFDEEIKLRGGNRN